MVKAIKQYSDKAVYKIAQKLPRFNPNFITIVGVLPPIIFFWLLIAGRPGWALFALAATVLDSVDGAYARATGQETKFGAFLDSTLDRLSDAIIISAFGYTGLVPWEIIVPTIIASFLISYTRSAAANVTIDNKTMAIGPIERSQRLIIIFLGLLVSNMYPDIGWDNWSLLQITFAALFLLSLTTVLRRINLFRKLSQ